jgi:hypothetical protein
MMTHGAQVRDMTVHGKADMAGGKVVQAHERAAAVHAISSELGMSRKHTMMLDQVRGLWLSLTPSSTHTQHPNTSRSKGGQSSHGSGVEWQPYHLVTKHAHARAALDAELLATRQLEEEEEKVLARYVAQIGELKILQVQELVCFSQLLMSCISLAPPGRAGA